MFYINFARYCEMIKKSPYEVAREIGIKSTNTIAGWKTGSIPRKKALDSIVDYFSENGLHISVYNLLSEDDASTMEQDAIAVREMLRNRPDAKILFDAAKDAPASALLQAAALLMKYKEESEGR